MGKWVSGEGETWVGPTYVHCQVWRIVMGGYERREGGSAGGAMAGAGQRHDLIMRVPLTWLSVEKPHCKGTKTETGSSCQNPDRNDE